MAASACLEIWLCKRSRISDLSDWEWSFVAVLLFFLDALFQKKDLISGNGVGYHSDRDFSSVRHAAPSLAFGSVCNSLWSGSLYDHIPDA